MLFDTVPGGAGGALRIARSFRTGPGDGSAADDPLRVRRGDELLRLLAQLPNQAFHDQLRRGDALALISQLV